MTGSVCSALLLLLLSRISVSLCAAEARELMAALDPTAQLVERFSEAGISFSDPMLPVYLEESSGDGFRELYAPLPDALARPSEYRYACNDIALEGGTLREDSLLLVLTAYMRHGDLELFQDALGLAGDNARYLLGEDAASLRFVYEMMSPLTPAVFLEAFLEAAGPSGGLVRMLAPRMSLLNPGHVEVLRRRCGAILKDFQREEMIAEGDRVHAAGPVDPFQRIVLNEDGPVAEGDSAFSRLSIGSHEIIYAAVAGNAHFTLNLHNGLSTADIVLQLMQAMRADSRLLLAAFVYERDAGEGVLVRTAGHAGPLMLVLGFDAETEACRPVEAVNKMMTAKDDGIIMASFAIKPGQFMLAFPESLVNAFEMGLYSQAASWFMDPPAGAHEVRSSFRSLLENRQVLDRTEIVYAALLDVLASSAKPMPASSSSPHGPAAEMQQGASEDGSGKGEEPEEMATGDVERMCGEPEQCGETPPFPSYYDYDYDFDFAFDSDSDDDEEDDAGHGKAEAEAEAEAEDADMLEGVVEEEAEDGRALEAVQRRACPARTLAAAYALLISVALLCLIDSLWPMFLA
jgi:hypothetical protein